MPVRTIAIALTVGALHLLAGCGADVRRNPPAVSFVSAKTMRDMAQCLIPPLNSAALGLTNDISKFLNTAPAVTNQVRTIQPDMIIEIGPVHPNHADWYVVRLTRLDGSHTKVELLPGALRPDVPSLLGPAVQGCE